MQDLILMKAVDEVMGIEAHPRGFIPLCICHTFVVMVIKQVLVRTIQDLGMKEIKNPLMDS